MSTSGPDPRSLEGWVDRELQAEFPALALVSLALAGRPMRSPSGVRERLALLSSRFRGAVALTLRQAPVPAAYRLFSRQVGLDPDLTPPPGEAAALERLIAGGFRSVELVADALLIALLETGVPVWALDADSLDGPLGVRPALAGEAFGRGAQGGALPAGRLTVADGAGPVAVVLGDVAPGHAVTRSTRSLMLFALRVPGVPAIHVEEALWTCATVLESS